MDEKMISRVPHGGDIYVRHVNIDFSVSLDPLGVPKRVKRKLKKAASRCAAVYPDPECRSLRRAVARYEGVGEETVIFGNGATELIYAWCRLAGGKILMPSPSFGEYEAGVLAAGGETCFARLEEANDFDPKGFVETLRDFNGDGVIICQPLNPTGRITDRETLARIVEICREKNMRLLADECFIDLSDDPSMTLKDTVGEWGGLFVLKAMTKTYALSGLRVGYGMSSDRAFLEKMRSSLPPWNVSTFACEAGEAALGEEKYLLRARRMIRAERERLEAVLVSLGFRVIPSEANFILFKGPSDLGERLERRGMLIRDASSFRGLCGGWFRVGIRTPRENRKLAETLRAVTGKGENDG